MYTLHLSFIMFFFFGGITKRTQFCDIDLFVVVKSSLFNFRSISFNHLFVFAMEVCYKDHSFYSCQVLQIVLTQKSIDWLTFIFSVPFNLTIFINLNRKDTGHINHLNCINRLTLKLIELQYKYWDNWLSFTINNTDNCLFWV